MLYPTLVEMFTNPKTGLFKKYPPKEIWTDYTSEKSFSEFLETHFYPAFANPHSKHYKKWRIVHPMISTQASNLEMKQNFSQMLQPDENDFTVFQFPDPKKTRPETGIIIQEAKEQTLREAAHSMKSGAGMTKPVFPKPVGYDNDLIRALELAAMGARKYAKSISNQPGKLIIKGSKLAVPSENPVKDMWDRKIDRMTRQYNVTDKQTWIPDV